MEGVMGLDVSHNAWHGAYSAFMRWRTEIARLCGIPLNFMEGFYGEDMRRTIGLFRHMESKGQPRTMVTEHMSNTWITDGLERSVSVFPIKWETLRYDPIHHLLNHSDCEGEITPKRAAKIADRLTEILPMLPEKDDGGHIGNWREKTQRFIDGCRAAADANEPLRFR
jgi:hypothetical protein